MRTVTTELLTEMSQQQYTPYVRINLWDTDPNESLSSIIYFTAGQRYNAEPGVVSQILKLVDGVITVVHTFTDEDAWPEISALHYSPTTGKVYIITKENSALAWQDINSIYELDPTDDSVTFKLSYYCQEEGVEEGDYATCIIEKDDKLHIVHGGYGNADYTAVYDLNTNTIQTSNDIPGGNYLNNSAVWSEANNRWYLTMADYIYESTDFLTWTNPRTVKNPSVINSYNDSFICGIGVHPTSGKVYFGSYNSDYPETYNPVSYLYSSIWSIDGSNNISFETELKLPLHHVNGDPTTADTDPTAPNYSSDESNMFATALQYNGDLYVCTWGWYNDDPVYMYKVNGDGTWDTSMQLSAEYDSLGQGSMLVVGTDVYILTYDGTTTTKLLKWDGATVTIVDQFTNRVPCSSWMGTLGMCVVGG
jgi:glutamine cyclotransferase